MGGRGVQSQGLEQLLKTPSPAQCRAQGVQGPTPAQLLTFSWVRMFSHCSFTERLWITLKSQAQKTLMARSPVELPMR